MSDDASDDATDVGLGAHSAAWALSAGRDETLPEWDPRSSAELATLCGLAVQLHSSSCAGLMRRS